MNSPGRKRPRSDEETASSSTPRAAAVGRNDLTRKNHYTGFVPPRLHVGMEDASTVVDDGLKNGNNSGRQQQLDRVSPAMDPAEFFCQYIAPRKPCVITGLPQQLLVDGSGGGNDDQNNSSKVGSWEVVTPQHLAQLAGTCKVQVEKRADDSASFGQNRSKKHQVNMTLAELCDKISSKEPDSLLYYLSTQEVQDEQRDPFATTPIRQLRSAGLVPESLPLAGHLVLQSCNLWMAGAAPTRATSSSSSSSSGLHHDYHDNFYLLLEGTKQFHLYPPSLAEHMSLYGTIDRIHCNGVISYESCPTGANGRPLHDVEKDNDDEDQQEQVDVSVGSDDEDEDEVVLGKGFDYRSDDDSADPTQDQAQIARLLNDENGEPVEDDYEKLVAVTDSDNYNDAQGDSKGDDDSPARRPDNFSSIANPDSADIAKMHPDFALHCRPFCVLEQLQPGQCLYLPAGWFHLVTSSCCSVSPVSDATSANAASDGKNYHLAVNYWYHPPDRLNSYQNPYQDDYWRSQMAETGNNDELENKRS